MRTKLLFSSVDASTQQVSEVVNMDQRSWWKLRFDSDSLDGTPQFYVEEAYTGGR